MTDLKEASILFLDDQEKHLHHTKNFFEGLGFNITTTKSIDEAKNNGTKKMHNVFICDLRLNEISENENGTSILRHIRNLNKDVFLGLYTAYYNDLKKIEKRGLDEDHVKIYWKGNDHEFILNLQKDYARFLKSRKEKASKLGDPSDRTRLLLDVKHLVIDHLTKVSNQELTVPIPGEKDLLVKDLIKETVRESPIGITYMQEWVKTIARIEEIRKGD